MLNFEVKAFQRFYICPVLYFAYEEYRTDDSNSPAYWYHASETLQRYSTVTVR